MEDGNVIENAANDLAFCCSHPCRQALAERIKETIESFIWTALKETPHADCGQDDCPCVRRGIDLMAKSMRQR